MFCALFFTGSAWLCVLCAWEGQTFRHPNLLALEDFSFSRDGREAIMLFDYFSRGTLADLAQTMRWVCVVAV